MKAELVDGELHVLGRVFSLDRAIDLTGLWVTELPDDLFVYKSLFLCGTWLTKLPENLFVCHVLDIRDTDITTFPDSLNVRKQIITSQRVENLKFGKGEWRFAGNVWTSYTRASAYNYKRIYDDPLEQNFISSRISYI